MSVPQFLRFKGRTLIYKRTILGTTMIIIIRRRRRRIERINWQFLGASSSLLWSRSALVKTYLAYYAFSRLAFPIIFFSYFISLPYFTKSHLIISYLIIFYPSLPWFTSDRPSHRFDLHLFDYRFWQVCRPPSITYMPYFFFPNSSYLQHFFPFDCAFPLNQVHLQYAHEALIHSTTSILDILLL
jgi:hypothetical protein